MDVKRRAVFIGLDTIEVLALSQQNWSGKAQSSPSSAAPGSQRRTRGKMYVLGGFDEHDEVIRALSIFDHATGNWSEGPALPGGAATDGFAPAACVHGRKLYVSVDDGGLYRLNEPAKRWDKWVRRCRGLLTGSCQMARTSWRWGGARTKGKTRIWSKPSGSTGSPGTWPRGERKRRGRVNSSCSWTTISEPHERARGSIRRSQPTLR
jgi:hypothetical protein